MAFFRDYLLQNDQTINFNFSEDDEAALVLFLLHARLNGSARGLQVPADFTAPEHLPEQLTSPKEQDELKFITVFLCFFITKAEIYMSDIANFKEYFIPEFATSTEKQTQLADLLRGDFFSATIDDIARAPSLGKFVDTLKIPVVA
jgi:hypothetical protein